MLAALAVAATIPIAPSQGDGVVSYAAADNRAIYAVATPHRVTVHSKRFGARGRGRVIARLRVPAGQKFVHPFVDVSGQRFALSIDTEDGEHYSRYTGTFGGRIGGPLRTLEPFRDRAFTDEIVAGTQVAGSRYLTAYLGLQPLRIHYEVRRAGRRSRRLSLPRRAFVFGFTARHIAYFSKRKLVVSRWRTGTVERRYTYDPDYPTDLRRDGTIAYVRGDQLRVAAPGAPPRVLARVPDAYAGSMSWAGRRIAIASDRHVVVVDPDGATRRIRSPHGTYVSGVVADALHVMWNAEGRIVAAAP